MPDLIDPELPPGALVETGPDGSGRRNDRMPLSPAAQNPWYVLATVFGEPGPKEDRELDAKNRRIWNGWACTGRSSQEQEDIAKALNVALEEVAPLTPQERLKIEHAFSRRLPTGTAIPEPTQEIDLRRVFFPVRVGWAKMFFPATLRLEGAHFSADLYLSRSRFDADLRAPRAHFAHRASFAGLVVRGTTRFSKAYFAQGVKLDGSEFRGSARFAEASFHGTARFSHLCFGADAGFKNAEFHEEAGFGAAEFEGSAGFEKAHFFKAAKFGGAEFRGSTRFDDATFVETCDFGGAGFSVQAKFEAVTFQKTAKFGGARFADDVGFTRADFLERAVFSGTRFAAIADFSKVQFRAHAAFDNAAFAGVCSFAGAIFSNGAAFSDKAFQARTDFKDAVFQADVPAFYQRQFHQDTVFTIRQENWPEITAQNAEEGQRAYTRLRQVMSDLQKTDEEHFFFRQEMRCKQVLEEDWPGRVLIRAYGAVSDFGNSIGRPASALAMIWAIGAAALAGWSLHSAALSLGGAMALSFANLFPFFGFQRLYFGADLFQALPEALRLLAGAQTVLSFPLLYFLGLGLRNRFRLK